MIAPWASRSCVRGAAPVAAFLSLSLPGVALGAAGERALVVSPGETIAFGLPDAIEGDCGRPSPAGLSSCLVDTVSPPGSALSSFVVARERLSSAKAEVRQTHDFEVDGGWGTGALLDATLSGTIDVRGFLLLIGAGHARIEVVVELLDVTVPAAPTVVACRSVAAHELAGEFSPGVGFGLDVEGGAPYIGGGASICASIGLTFLLEPVEESVDFVLPATLRRGNAYRLVVRSSSEAELSAVGLGVGGPLRGRAVAGFYDPAALADPDALVPNLLADFLARLDGLVHQRLSLPTEGSFKNVRGFEENSGVPGLFDRLKFKIERQGDSVSDVLRAFGVSSNDLRGMADEFFDLSDAQLLEEQIEEPGVRATRLCLTLRQDEAEVRERCEIEGALERRASVVRHFLPAAQGGLLERVFDLVQERIEQSEAAGLVVTAARVDLAQAQASYAQRQYRTAHRKLIDAYRHLASGS